ncbi:hypothetical protein BDV96DRAFT_493643 [Lophiotrema nucula]|uniref:DUF7607 domain-containing protein n=1 Tax=Lophiotrema nucula TaxID=690887 RepID=A0A6A5Z8S1_9PLEO|nr:hypothetical protein BDV96DRAFT_493643 [Lophiotrema nucula]
MEKWGRSTNRRAQTHQSTQILDQSQAATATQTSFHQQLKLEPVSDGEDEGQADVAEPAASRRRGKLSKEEIGGIINAMIAELTDNWHQKELLILIPTARALWLAAESKGRRQQLADAKGVDIQVHRDMLDRAGDEISDTKWYSENRLRTQCKSLEALVNNLEKTSWEHALYRQSSAPSEIDPSLLEDEEALMPVCQEPEFGSLGAAETIPPAQNSATTPSPTPPPPNRVTLERRPTHNQLSDRSARRHDDRPEDASFATVAGWRWDDLVEHNDRKRLIMKLIQKMSEDERDVVRGRLQVKKHRLLAEIPDCTNMMLRGESRMPGVLPRDQEKIVKWTQLFLSWWTCDDCLKQPPSASQLNELAQCLQDESRDPDDFYEWIMHIMAKTFKKGSYSLKASGPPPGTEVIVLSDSD